MKDYTSRDLENELEGIGFIFNPMIIHDGSYYLYLGDFKKLLDYDIDKDVFVLNSKKVKNDNLYKLFLDKFFYRNVINNNLLDNKQGVNKDSFIPLLISDMSKDGKSRFVKYDYLLSLMKLIEVAGVGTFDVDKLDDENIRFDYVYKIVKEKRDMLLNVIRLGKDSKYYKTISDVFTENGMVYRNEIIQMEANRCSDVMICVKRLKELDKVNIFDVDEFKKCFDIHKLYLMLAKIIVDDTLYHERVDGVINNCFIDAYQYVIEVEELGLKNYNPSIIYNDAETNKIKVYTFSDLKKEIENIISRHPEFKVVRLNSEDPKINNIINDVEAARNYAQKIIDRETLLANWEFVRKGSVDKEKENKELLQRIYNLSEVKRDSKDFNKILLEKKELFENTNYVYRIVGLNKFEGYIGYIYSNGIVAFEKMYEDKEQTIPARGSNAIYIMTIENFVEFSKKSKVEIIDYIKNTNNANVWRIYHNSTTKDRLYKFISGVYYSKEVEEEIDKLINEEVLTKKLTNKE